MTQTPVQTEEQKTRPYGLRNRYVFKGKLEMTTGLHIGGGKATLSHSDSPVVLTPDGLPYIPGSSFKGSLRSTVEKMVASLPDTLGLRACGLQEETEDEPCPTAHQKEINARRRGETLEKARETLALARAHLCQACQLFGSPFAAARIAVNDLTLLDETWSTRTQVRDGVAIDRDTETARDGRKYDFEVVPATTAFQLRLVLENATTQDLHLLSIGLSEFISGFGTIGGFRSRGLGSCELKDLTLFVLDLEHGEASERRQRLSAYLRRDRENPESGLQPRSTRQFFEDYLECLFPDKPISK